MTTDSDPPGPSSGNVVSSTGIPSRTGALLAYSGWWITGLIVWFVERQDLYVRFHAAQSIAAFGLVAMFVAGFGMMALVSLSFLPSAFALFLGAAAATLAIGLVLWAVALWMAGNGRTWRIPIAGDLADRML